MAFGIDFGLATPTTAFDPQAAVKAGQQLGQQRAVQNALQTYGDDPNGSINALVRAGALQQANALNEMAQAKTERENKATVGQAIASAIKPDGSFDPAATASAEKTVLGTGDLSTYSQLHGFVAQQSADAKAKLATANEAAARVAATASAIGDDDTPDVLHKRSQYIESQRADLISQGVDPNQISQVSAHPDSGSLSGVVNRAQTLSDILKGQQSDAELQLKKDTLAATRSHNAAEEMIGRTTAGAAVTRAGAAVTSAAAASRNASTAANALSAKTGPDGKIIRGPGRGAKPNVTLQTGGLGIILPTGASLDPDK